MEGSGEGEGDIAADGVHDLDVRRQVLAGNGPANDGANERGDRRVGLHSLTPELLTAVMKALPESAGSDESREAAGNELLPYRCVSKAFREAVDATVVGHGFTIRSRHNGRDGMLLLSVLRGFRRSLPLWPHLMDLHLKFNWPSDHLHVALGTIADVCLSLRRIRLELETEGVRLEADQPCLVPLAALPHLESLDLKAFRLFPRWSEGLSLLPSLSELHVTDPGPFDLELLPSLTHLDIRPTYEETPSGFRGPIPSHPPGPHVTLRHLPQATNLREVHIYDVSIHTLTIPPGCPTLTHLILDGVEIGHSLEGGLGPLLSGPSPLPHLEDLFLADLRVPGNLSLSACVGLKHLTLRLLPRVRSLDGIPSFHLLEYLHLDTLLELRELPHFGPRCLPRLLSLELLHLDKLEHLPPLTTFPNLLELTLSNLKRVAHAPGLGDLASLETLKIKACPLLDLPDAALSTLHNLKSLYVTGEAGAMEHLPLRFALPHHASLPKLETLTLGFCSDPPRGLQLVGQYEALRSLTLTHVSNMKQMPFTFHKLEALTQLTISGCPELRGVQLLGLRSLRQLTLKNFVFETSLPETGHLVDLEELVIEGFTLLLALGDFRGNVVLREVTVKDCLLLKEADLRGAPSIRKFNITDCGALEEVKLADLAEMDLTRCSSLRRISR